MNRFKQSKTHGFTIVELLIVIVVIGILAAIVIVAYNGIQKRAAETTLQSDLKQASSQLGIYNVDNGAYPTDISMLNGGQGLKKSNDTDYQYTYSAVTNSYCITATSNTAGASSYKFDSQVGSIESGLCPGHVLPVSGPTLGWTSVTTGYNHTCGIYNNLPYCWGQGALGRLGNGGTTDSSVPVPVNMSGVLAGKTVTKISAGSNHTCVVADGAAYCWGSGSNNHVGNGSVGTFSSPVAVSTSGVLSGKTVTDISANQDHTCVVASGAAYCWGGGSYGVRGNGSTSGTFTVVAVDTTGALAGKTVTSIVAGGVNTCAIADSLPYCWGYGPNNVLGNGTTTDTSVPVAVNVSGVLSGKTLSFLTVSNTETSNGGRACIIGNGAAHCWGGGGYAQLASNPPTTSSVPLAVTTAGLLGGKTVTNIEAGTNHTCVVADSDVYCWGTNGLGQLGNGTTTTSYNPVAVTAAGTLSGKSITALSMGYQNSCAVASGNLYCWGHNQYGKLGDGTTTNSSVPVQVTNP